MSDAQQHLINALVNQRNAAQNEIAQLAAQLGVATDRIAELEAEAPDNKSADAVDKVKQKK